jgi:hypothetical protein
MKHLNQKGFTLVEGLLLIIALSLVTGVGYYVYNSSQDSNTSAPSTKTVARPVSNSKKYLSIAELGVKFELNNRLKNAYYAKVDDYYYVSVNELDDACPAGQDKGLGLMAIIDAKVGEPNTTVAAESTWTQSELDETGWKKVGDTYYGFMRGNAPCYDPNAPDADQQSAKAADYMKAFIAQTSTFQKL